MAQHAASLKVEGDGTGILDAIKGLGQAVSTLEGSLAVLFLSDLNASDLFEWAKRASCLENCSWILSVQESGGGELLMKPDCTRLQTCTRPMQRSM